MKPIVFIIAAMALASPSAWASTELSTGAASPITFSDEPSSPSGRDNSSSLGPGSQTEPSLSEEAAADDDAFTVSDALLKVNPAASNRTPSSWIIPLIAFAGLTAFFTGKRSGGRGLIFV
jgi:hypothetical protein